MKILVTGGGGFLGFRLARALLARGKLNGQAISAITLLDGAFPPEAAGVAANDPRLQTVIGDVSRAEVLAQVCRADTGAVFHLAAVVSGAAEAHFDLGMRVNFDGTRQLLEQIRKGGRAPRVVYSSSVAAFGGELPPVLDDSTAANPQTSYGTQKVIGEYLLADYTRKGFLDGRALRLPTIVVRAGKPNAAASSFASAIIREPLNGQVYRCPVPPETGVWLLSPRRVVESFIRACEMRSAVWGDRRVVNLPGITARVAEMVEAMRKLAGTRAARRVDYQTDARIQTIVKTWPVRFRTPRALQMGFQPDADVETLIRDYITDEHINV